MEIAGIDSTQVPRGGGGGGSGGGGGGLNNALPAPAGWASHLMNFTSFCMILSNLIQFGQLEIHETHGFRWLHTTAFCLQAHWR